MDEIHSKAHNKALNKKGSIYFYNNKIYFKRIKIMLNADTRWYLCTLLRRKEVFIF